MNKKGFTLVELLVVIAIIAILSTLIQARYTVAMAKSRDADRLNDLRHMSNVLMELSIENPSLLFDTPCDLADTSTTNCTGATQPGDIENKFQKYIDPLFSSAVSANASPCTGGDMAPCQYSIQDPGANVSDVIIQFYLEHKVDGLAEGAHTMTAGGAFN